MTKLPVLALFGLAAALPAEAAVDLSALDMRVAMFAGALPGQEGGPRAPIDRRLKLADCGGEPAISWRSERQDAVVVECKGPTAWRIFVPVMRGSAAAAPVRNASVQAVSAPRPTAAEPVIRRGDAVTVRVSTGAFSVTRDGVAMTDAAPGARVRIKIDDRAVPVQAVAVEPGLATVPQGIS
ncbi:flagella basal body P-ring formation protein FlgA [Sphingomonas sp. ID0503]|uniref:flagella basal body P-ring formation protein FlgA n=1 Tax=Sphingomonas sp. ID0503 TaxID=3399691 RepID=UPI003AFA62BB